MLIWALWMRSRLAYEWSFSIDHCAGQFSSSIPLFVTVGPQWSRRWDNTSDAINISHTFIISFLFHSHFFLIWIHSPYTACKDVWGREGGEVWVSNYHFNLLIIFGAAMVEMMLFGTETLIFTAAFWIVKGPRGVWRSLSAD